MNGSRGIMLAGLVFVLAASGCAPAATTTPIPPLDLNVSRTSQTRNVKASGEVVPIHIAELSFVTSGMVTEVLVNEGDRVEAGQALLRLDVTEQEFAISAAEKALFSAEVNARLKRIRNKEYDIDQGRFIHKSGPGEYFVIADARVDQRQAELDVATAELAQRTLSAPFDSTIIEIDISPGEAVQVSQVVMTLADISNLQVETTDLSELNIATVKIGQPSSVFIEALDEEFDGKVSAISPISNTIGGDVVFKVTIQIEKQPAGLRWGMSTEVEIQTEQ